MFGSTCVASVHKHQVSGPIFMYQTLIPLNYTQYQSTNLTAETQGSNMIHLCVHCSCAAIHLVTGNEK